MNAITPNPAPQPVDLEKYTLKYVQLRDLIKAKEDAFKKEIAPAKEMLERLNAMLLNHLNMLGIDSAASGAGTVYRKSVVSVTMPDAGAFRDYVIANKAFDLADIRPAKAAVEGFVGEHKMLPPGVNYSVSYDVGVRRGKEATAPAAPAAPSAA